MRFIIFTEISGEESSRIGEFSEVFCDLLSNHIKREEIDWHAFQLHMFSYCNYIPWYFELEFLHCKKYLNFTWFPGVELLQKGTVSA